MISVYIYIYIYIYVYVRICFDIKFCSRALSLLALLVGFRSKLEPKKAGGALWLPTQVNLAAFQKQRVPGASALSMWAKREASEKVPLTAAKTMISVGSFNPHRSVSTSQGSSLRVSSY